MCPDKSLLSAFYDNEIDEPWKGEIIKHMAACSACRSQFEELKEMSLFLQQDKLVIDGRTGDDIYKQVFHQHRRSRILPVWERMNPWPLAVAALLILGISLIIPFSKTKESFITPSLVLIENDQVDLSDMDNLIPIMLPPKQKFSYYGDSQLLKAAGFEGDTLP
jgi:hypothetical protein